MQTYFDMWTALRDALEEKVKEDSGEPSMVAVCKCVAYREIICVMRSTKNQYDCESVRQAGY